jgi:chromosome segregation ATPase
LIEQALFFAIGFLAASLVAVVAMPIISHRAMRLSQARARLQAPITKQQAVAERDALRAQHAVERVRLERRVSVAEESSVALKAEVGRHAVKIIGLESDLAERDGVLLDQRAEIEKRVSESRDLEAALTASQIALHDLGEQRDLAKVAEAEAAARRTELESEASRDRAKIAMLAARGENLESRLEDLSHAAKIVTEKAQKVHAQLTESLAIESDKARLLEERLREAISQNERLSERLSRDDVEGDQNRRKLAELEARLVASEKIREETLLETGRQLAELADRDAALKSAHAKATELEARLAAVGAEANAASESAERAGRADRETLERENEGLRARIAAITASAVAGGDDAALRDSIERLGREVARLFSERRSADQDDSDRTRRFAFGRAGAGALAEPTSDERHGFAEGSERRVARSRAHER